MTDAEQAIIELLWGKGRASIRQIVDTLHADDPGQTRYATIQKQLERMEAKGLVKRDRSLFVHLFVPALSREEMIGRKLQTVIDKLCGGSLVPLLSHLAHARELTDAERRALRELVEKRSTPPKRRGK